MGADFCDSTCLGVRCDELCGTGEPDPHTRIAGKAQHWAVVTDGFFAIWYDGWLEPNCTGPVAESLYALGAGMRAIGEAWLDALDDYWIAQYEDSPGVVAARRAFDESLWETAVAPCATALAYGLRTIGEAWEVPHA